MVGVECAQNNRQKEGIVMIKRWIATGVLLAFSTAAWAISPYIQGDSVAAGSVQAVASAVESRLKGEGFKLVGKYFPKELPGAGVVIVTDEAMLNEVGSVGGPAILGAAMRVGVKADGSVAYTNPDKKEGAVKDLQARLQNALGAGKSVGGEETAGSLTNYRYMIGMERLDSHKNKLAEAGSFAEAVKTVRDNLAKGAGKTAKVYEVVLPDRKLAVFGVAMNDGDNSDGAWLKRIEMQNNFVALPYEIYIVDKSIEAPHARFRLALSFPDLGMGQFMRISSLPSAIVETMSSVAGADKKSSGDAWQ